VTSRRPLASSLGQCHADGESRKGLQIDSVTGAEEQIWHASLRGTTNADELDEESNDSGESDDEKVNDMYTQTSEPAASGAKAGGMVASAADADWVLTGLGSSKDMPASGGEGEPASGGTGWARMTSYDRHMAAGDEWVAREIHGSWRYLSTPFPEEEKFFHPQYCKSKREAQQRTTWKGKPSSGGKGKPASSGGERPGSSSKGMPASGGKGQDSEKDNTFFSHDLIRAGH
jgi:hypothetical protein